MKALKLLVKTNDSFAPLIARLTLGIVMFPHGAQKALGWFGGYGFSGTMNAFTQQMHILAPLAFLAIAAEFAGSIGLILGCFSRVAAFGIATNMVVAILTVHAANGFFMNWFGTQKGEGFEYHLLAIGLALVVIVYGAGKASLDNVFAKSVEKK
ncbi:MAG TPA: DoxX family protein [Methylomirabilota bacterium]|nr:DoxX family protein [Methylomirabilota bacterium]